MTQRKPVFTDTVKDITGKDAPAFTFVHRIYEKKRALGLIPYRVLRRQQTFIIPVDTCGLDNDAYESALAGLREDWNNTQRLRRSARLSVEADIAKQETYLV